MAGCSSCPCTHASRRKRTPASPWEPLPGLTLLMAILAPDAPVEARAHDAHASLAEHFAHGVAIGEAVLERGVRRQITHLGRRDGDAGEKVRRQGHGNGGRRGHRVAILAGRHFRDEGRSGGAGAYHAGMTRKLSLVVGSLAGAVLVHLALVACGPKGAGTVPSASAQTAPTAPTCSTWQVAGYFYSADGLSYGATFPANQVFAQQTLPAGWEPIGVTPMGTGNNEFGGLVTMRKCAQ